MPAETAVSVPTRPPSVTVPAAIPLTTPGFFLYKSLHPAQDFRADIVQIRHHGGQILTDGDFQTVSCGLHQGQPAVHVVEHGACHFIGRSGAVVQSCGVVRKRLPALGCGLAAPGHDGLQFRILVRAGNDLCKVGLLLVGQGAPDTGHACEDAGQALHIAVRIINLHTVFCKGVPALFRVGCKAGEDGVQGRASSPPLTPALGHDSPAQRWFPRPSSRGM